MMASAAQTSPAAPVRRRLPSRRDSVVFEVDLDGTRYRAQVSQFPDGAPGELFLDGPKIGSAACIAARDAAVAASLALQHGCDAAALHHSCVKLSNGLSAGPVGCALDLLGDAT
jgi:ribonucleoside-diphosphate reductase alpha chain